MAGQLEQDPRFGPGRQPVRLAAGELDEQLEQQRRAQGVERARLDQDLAAIDGEIAAVSASVDDVDQAAQDLELNKAAQDLANTDVSGLGQLDELADDDLLVVWRAGVPWAVQAVTLKNYLAAG